MNIVTLIGNVGSDPEFRGSEDNPVGRLRLATNEKWTGKNGEKQELVEWHTIVFFGGVNKVVKGFVKKGDRIAVVGKIHYSEFEKDGEKRYGVEIQCGMGGKLELLGGKKAQGEGGGGNERFQATDDDVPF
jgi:single-strand DNA-binding protein